MYLATKAADPTRPVIDASGYSHQVRTTGRDRLALLRAGSDAFRNQQAGLEVGDPYLNDEDGGVISAVPSCRVVLSVDGKATVTESPPTSFGAMSMVPLCARVMATAIASPRPCPRVSDWVRPAGR